LSANLSAVKSKGALTGQRETRKDLIGVFGDKISPFFPNRNSNFHFDNGLFGDVADYFKHHGQRDSVKAGNITSEQKDTLQCNRAILRLLSVIMEKAGQRVRIHHKELYASQTCNPP